MKQHPNLVRHIVLLAAGIGLAGCSNWSYSPPMRGNPNTYGWNLSSVQKAAPSNPTDFGQALTADYAQLASNLSNQDHDWADSDYFSRKGLAAASGKAVPPENNANWLVPLEVPYKYRTDLADSRTRLVKALDSVKEGDRTLLDNSLVLAHSETEFAKFHTIDNIPMMLAGGAGGRMKPGQHIAVAGDPVTRVALTAQQALGMPVGAWGMGSMQTGKPISEVLA